MRTTYSSLQHQARKARTWFCKENEAILETHFMYVCMLSRFSHIWLFACEAIWPLAFLLGEGIFFFFFFLPI